MSIVLPSPPPSTSSPRSSTKAESCTSTRPFDAQVADRDVTAALQLDPGDHDALAGCPCEDDGRREVDSIEREERVVPRARGARRPPRRRRSRARDCRPRRAPRAGTPIGGAHAGAPASGSGAASARPPSWPGTGSRPPSRSGSPGAPSAPIAPAASRAVRPRRPRARTDPPSCLRNPRTRGARTRAARAARRPSFDRIEPSCSFLAGAALSVGRDLHVPVRVGRDERDEERAHVAARDLELVLGERARVAVAARRRDPATREVLEESDST